MTVLPGDQVDSAETDPAPGPRDTLVARIAVAVGSVGLVLAMAADSIAVLGRHTGFSLLGAIEIVQVAIVLLASAAIVLATLQGQHAAVHILTERLRPDTAARLARNADALSSILFAVLTVGAIWLLHDLWHGYERSELLHVPFRVLRVIFTVALIAVTLEFARRTFARRAA